MESYGDWMFDRRDFEDSALGQFSAFSYASLLTTSAYQTAKKTSKAMIAYEKAHSWRPLFYLATQSEMPKEKVVELAYRVAGWLFVVLCSFHRLTRHPEDLSSRKRWADAATVYHDYASDIEETVRALTNGNELAEAFRIVGLPHFKLILYSKPLYQTSHHRRPELIDSIIHPGALDLTSQMHDDLEEMDEQLKKQYNRLQELRRAKSENPGKFHQVARGMI